RVAEAENSAPRAVQAEATANRAGLLHKDIHVMVDVALHRPPLGPIRPVQGGLSPVAVIGGPTIAINVLRFQGVPSLRLCRPRACRPRTGQASAALTPDLVICGDQNRTPSRKSAALTNHSSFTSNLFQPPSDGGTAPNVGGSVDSSPARPPPAEIRKLQRHHKKNSTTSEKLPQPFAHQSCGSGNILRFRS